MIDNFALAVSHGLMMLAIWILLRRPDLNHEPSPFDRDAKGRLRGEGGFEDPDKRKGHPRA